MQANSYEKLSRHELECRLNFLENQLKYMASELSKANEKNDKLTELNKEYKVELDRIIELYKLALDRLYGKKAEKIEVVPDGQLSMFEELRNDILIEAPKQTVAAHTRARKRTFKEIYGNLPTRIEYYALTDDEKICPCCGKEMYMFAPECRCEIVHQPAVYEVTEIQREKCYCRNCEFRTNENGEPLPSVYRIAKAPEALIEGSYASPSLMASEIHKKFCMHLPITRIESEYKSMGFERSKQTICNNILDCADILEPLYAVCHSQLLMMEMIYADETHGQVNHVKGHDKPVNGYFWIYRSGKFEEIQLVIYDHQNGRGVEYPQVFLKGFKGYCHCDGYAAYDSVHGLVRVGCFAHLRRYFLEAVKVQDDKNDLTTAAGQGLLMINDIFHIEGRDPNDPHRKSNYTLKEIAAIREKYTSKMLKDFFEWCTKKSVESLPSEKTRKAITYALNQKENLMRVLDDPRLELTNNAAERAIRPVTVGRKNWLFCDSERGAHAAAVLYTIVNTAKLNGLKVYDYLNWVFERIRRCDFGSMEELAPWSKKIPEYIILGGSYAKEEIKQTDKFQALESA